EVWDADGVTHKRLHNGDAEVGDTFERDDGVVVTIEPWVNRHLTKVALSSVANDPKVAGVFQRFDEDGDVEVAQTGDFVIRIGSGVSVANGDLLTSAGDGTAKPQDDDILRSSTIAKVTSAQAVETYGDGSYLV